MIAMSKVQRRLVITAAELLLAGISNYVAFLLRFDGGPIPEEHVGPFLVGLPILLAFRCSAFALFRIHHGLWRYASVSDVQAIVGAVALSSVAFAATMSVIFSLGPYPRSIYLIDGIVLIGLMAGARLLRRAYHDYDRFRTEKRVLIFGAGDAGEMLVRDMKHNSFYNSEPVGFVDDDLAKVGRTIHGVRVLGTRADLPQIIATCKPNEVIVAIQRAQPGQIRRIVSSLEPYKVPIKTVPSLRDVLAGRVTVSQVRQMSLEDLMSRPPVGLSAEPVARMICGRRVLVTGAGGSIGSELSRQLASFSPESLVVLDRYENGLFDLCQGLRQRGLPHTPVIADITDVARIDAVFASARPDVVFHAAAHKHVPLMEDNPAEAVKNNIGGTRILAEAAQRAQVGKFVLISSDKAVNPSSVMGATKRAAELVVCAAGEQSSVTRFVAVRFGNVLGSNGSVVGIFERQIAAGGPVTVTHPEMRRYFMLIPEAVSLVLHAAAMRDAGRIYALDMGEQIPLVDIARNMIRLAGFVPEEEIPIAFVGVRPGEKLFEELWESGEVTERSEVEKIYRVRPKPVPQDLAARLHLLESVAATGHDTQAVALLADLIPSFTPDVRTSVMRDANMTSPTLIGGRPTVGL